EEPRVAGDAARQQPREEQEGVDGQKDDGVDAHAGQRAVTATGDLLVDLELERVLHQRHSSSLLPRGVGNSLSMLLLILLLLLVLLLAATGPTYVARRPRRRVVETV